MTPNLPPHDGHDGHDDFGGLHRDLPGLIGRRRALAVLGGAGLAGLLAACSSSDQVTSSTGTAGDASTTTSTSTTTASPIASTTTASTAVAPASVAASDAVADAGEAIPDETAGPYPSDGSNGPNILTEDGIVRPDITTSIGSLSGTADGIPLTIQLTVVEATTGAPLPGAAVYLWHCTAGGAYSMYEITDQNYLRGVQVADDAGRLAFTTVFPGCYRGRWPHCHFEVYDAVGDATAGSHATTTSQLALPQADCESVYGDARYGNSAGNLAQLSLASDMVFRDGWQDQLATVSGSPGAGYTASLLVRV